MDGKPAGRVMWDLFIIIYPVFKEALPEIDGWNDDLFPHNNITKIRQGINALNFVFTNRNLDHKNLDDPKFSLPLFSLLKSFESLILNDIDGEYILSQELDSEECPGQTGV